MTDTTYSENLKIPCYDEAGGRKTLQIGNLSREFGHENVGIISCEHGLGTIKSLVDAKYVQEVNNREELREAYVWAKKTFTRPDQFVCVDGGSRVLNWIKEDYFFGAQRAYELWIEGKRRNELQGDDRM